MFVKVDNTGTVDGLKEILNQVSNHAEVKGLLILACDANTFSPTTINPILQNIKHPIFGGIFPEIIHGQEKYTQGTIVVGIYTKPAIHVIPKLSDMAIDYEDLIDEEIPDLGDTKTMFVLVDGLAQRISALIDSLFNLFGLDVNYIGGGAGSLSFEQKPCLFTNQGLIQDSALLVLLQVNSGVGVCHGWESIAGPLKVTESDRNIIKTLDWRPAFEIYREVVEKASGKKFTADNFFDIAKGYPFGINKLGSEKIVRDPIVKGDDDSLVCVGEVPSESYVDILSGNVSSLVNAARKALELGKEALQTESRSQSTIFIDCISRVLFLEDEFNQELNAVHQNDIPLIGALTLGEIANSGQDYLEFYNKTAVIGVLEG